MFHCKWPEFLRGKKRERDISIEISINIIRTCMALYITTTLPITSPLVGVPLSYYVLII